MTLQERMLELMKEYGIRNQAELAKFAGVSKGLITQWFSGQTELGTKPLLALTKKTNYTDHWLANGTEPKFKSGDFIIPTESGIAQLDETNLPENSHYQIQRYDYKLSAGGGNADWVVRESADDPLYFRKNWFRAKHVSPDTLRALYVRGDSMVPFLREADTVIIDLLDTEIVDGEIYAIIYRNKFYVKELQNFEDGVRIISHNDKYPVMEAKAEDWKGENYFQVLGRVIWRGG